MSDYNQFVIAVNKIFEITAKMKQGWKDNDNINLADSIEESKTTVVEAAKLFNTQATAPTPTSAQPAAPTETAPVETTPVEAPPVETTTEEVTTASEEPVTPDLTPPVTESLDEEVGALGE